MSSGQMAPQKVASTSGTEKQKERAKPQQEPTVGNTENKKTNEDRKICCLVVLCPWVSDMMNSQCVLPP
jgi:hypothetical protein